MIGFNELPVLLVEDEGMVALLIEDMLAQLGCKVTASASRVSQACELAKSTPVEIAILDVNLAGESVAPVARILQDRGIPFVFSTGYGRTGLPPGFSASPVITKPFSINELQAQVSAALSRAP
ncbi:response regulator [Dongia deserti]|uniref:response regulator n=1 Tax=Dongia deserti TaxID=2268030 RepID=UPI000E6474CC|nr:response regulator [Dongia deserti]